MAGEEKITIPESVKNGSAKQKPPLSPWRAYWRLLAYASPLDLGLRLCGMAAAVAAGSALPLMTIILGDFVQDFNDFNLGLIGPAKFRHAVNKNTLWLVYLFVGKLLVRASSFLKHCV
jgi:ATP-binding cassette subfamily B (MDR/TAP) protein 1